MRYNMYASYYQNRCKWCNKEFWGGDIEKGDEIPCYTCESAFHDVCFKYHTAHTCFVWSLEQGNKKVMDILWKIENKMYDKPFDFPEVTT